MTTPVPKTTFLRDYTPPAFAIEQVELDFDLHDDHARVKSRLRLHRSRPDEPLVLDGQQLELLSVAIDGRVLQAHEYAVDEEHLTITGVPDRFVVEIETRIRPQDNTALEGLYRSAAMFCTQCEPEGFRRISYYIDRPDAMTRFTTTIRADKVRYPVLLSNGNLEATGEEPNGRHWARWIDPFPKPCYLFALVAGDLACIEDRFRTCSGREVTLRIYVEPHNHDKCDHAMRSLKKAMRWDEDVYGREYDLDIYMIVAVDDFNMGAMENKGLNIFNSKYVLAQPAMATDADYLGIESVIAHEYFHNWSGNRVTCRDWFQLSLKEGFTVFRDQQFTADVFSRTVKRIEDVNRLRTHQFAEDASPMAHPVRPESYIEINNFYTATVYEKGAEVVCMLYTLMGAEGFRRGTDLYFARHDGQAVTTDDFVRALEDANGIDLSQFKRWYGQAGTPELDCRGEYDAKNHRYLLSVRQHCPATPGQPEKLPYHLPLAMGLLGQDGAALPLQLAGEGPSDTTHRVLHVRQAEERFVFENIAAAPVPSLLRHFSAPVKLNFDYSDNELMLLAAHDTDGFNRWEAIQRLAVRTLLTLTEHYRRSPDTAGTLDGSAERLIAVFGRVLDHPGDDLNFAAVALTLPSEQYLADFMAVVDPVAIHRARWRLRSEIGQRLATSLLACHERLAQTEYTTDAAAMGRRHLRNICLGYLAAREWPQDIDRCHRQYQQAGNMTDAIAALGCLCQIDAPAREAALADFYRRWQAEPLVVDKWFSLQASSRLATAVEVRRLLDHPAFNLRNPNKVRAVVGSFSQANPACFHAADGSGYALLADVVCQLNGLNPQIAARLLTPLVRWQRHDAVRQASMRTQLERVLALEGLSKDVYEVAAKGLGVGAG